MSRHSEQFRKIITSSTAREQIIDVIHRQPVIVFWITPGCQLLNAGTAHHDNPPKGDRSILAHRTHKGHLRGRSAFIGDVLYIVIYGDDAENRWSSRQRKHISLAIPLIQAALLEKGIDPYIVGQVKVIDEWGRE